MPKERTKDEPIWLDGDALAEFRRLRTLRTFEPDELDRLAEYALALVEVARKRKELAEEGDVLVSPRTGSTYTNPLYNQLVSATGRMDKLRDKLFPPKKAQVASARKAKSIREDLL